MISSIADSDVDPALIDELRRHDPVFSGTIVLEPFPESSLRDLIAEVHGALAVSAAVSREQITRGAALAPLSESKIATLVILGADAVAANAVRDLTRLRDFDRLQELILVTSSSHHTHERLADTRSPADTARCLARLAAEYREPSIATVPLSDGHADLGDRELDAVAWLARRVGHTMRFFRRPQVRLGVLAAALQLFDRPRSRPGTIVRLHALDVALHERGCRLRAGKFADAVAHCEARTQLDLWLPAAISPAPTRDPLTTLDGTLEHPIAMTADTTATWLDRFDQARTRKVYERALELFADWRARNAIAADDHDVEHLQDWAFDRLRAGAAPRTVEVQYAAVRRHHLYRLTGRHDATAKPSPVALRRPATPLALPEDLAARLGSSRGGPQTGSAPDLLSRRRYRPSLESPNAHRLLELFDNDPERAAARIEALRMPVELWLDVGPLLGPAAVRGDAQRLASCLNAIVLILATGLSWNALPLELNYGSGERAYRHLREWVQEGRWPAIRRALEEHGPTYRDLAWDRVSPSRSGGR
jgi:transposase